MKDCVKQTNKKKPSSRGVVTMYAGLDAWFDERCCKYG